MKIRAKFPTPALPVSGSLGVISAFRHPFRLQRQNYNFFYSVNRLNVKTVKFG